MTYPETTPPVLSYQTPRAKKSPVVVVILLWLGYLAGFVSASAVGYLVRPDPEKIAFFPFTMLFLAVGGFFPLALFAAALGVALRSEQRRLRRRAALGALLLGFGITSFVGVADVFITGENTGVIVILLGLWLLLPACLARCFSRVMFLTEEFCPKCGYDLRAHHPGDKCPACGKTVSHSKPEDQPRRR
jgi:hypothetical protein